MTYKAQLYPWCIIRPLPNMKSLIVGRFRRRSDAEGHLQILRKCSTCQQLRSLWLAIEQDYKKHKNQYDDKYQPFLCKIWTKRWNEQQLTESAVDF
jgi:hypothetical protein